MPSTQICPKSTRSTQSERVEAISGVGIDVLPLFGAKSQKIEEWYANTRYRNFFSLSQEKKMQGNLHKYKFMHHDHHPISIFFAAMFVVVKENRGNL